MLFQYMFEYMRADPPSTMHLFQDATVPDGTNVLQHAESVWATMQTKQPCLLPIAYANVLVYIRSADGLYLPLARTPPYGSPDHTY